MTGGYWGNVLLDVSEKTWETLWPRETSNKGFLRQAATTSGLKHFRIRSPGMAPARESYGCPSHQPPEETDLLLKQKLQRWFSGRAGFGAFPRGQWGNWAIPCPLFPPKKTMIDTDHYSLHNFYLKHSLLQLLGGGNIEKVPGWSCPGTPHPCDPVCCFLLWFFQNIAHTRSSWLKSWKFQWYLQWLFQFMFQEQNASVFLDGVYSGLILNEWFIPMNCS